MTVTSNPPCEPASQPSMHVIDKVPFVANPPDGVLVQLLEWQQQPRNNHQQCKTPTDQRHTVYNQDRWMDTVANVFKSRSRPCVLAGNLPRIYPSKRPWVTCTSKLESNVAILLKPQVAPLYHILWWLVLLALAFSFGWVPGRCYRTGSRIYTTVHKFLLLCGLQYLFV